MSSVERDGFSPDILQDSDRAGEIKNASETRSVIQIVENSLLDEKLVEGVDEARIPMTSFKLFFDKKKPSIQFKNEDGLGATWNLYAQNPGTVSYGKFRIGRFMVPFTKTADAIYADHHDVELSMDLVLNHLLKTFDCSNAIIEKVVVDLAVLEDPETTLCKLSNFHQIKCLDIGNSNTDGLSSFRANQHFWKVIPQILKILHGVEKVYINVPDSPSKFIPELMVIDSVILTNVNWITSEVVGDFSWKTSRLMKTKLTEFDISMILIKYLECPSNRMKVLDIEVEFEASAGAEFVMDALPADSFNLYERRPKIHGYDYPTPRGLFLAWSHYMRIIRDNGEAANVYFNPNLVIIEPSPPRMMEDPRPPWKV